MSGFSIYPRKRKNGKSVYYIQFKNPDGTYYTAKSTGCTTKRDAIAWAEDYLLRFGAPMPGREIIFGRYAEDFFSWAGKWALNHRIEGKRISEAHCKDREDIMRLHVLPVFGHLPLSGIDKGSIKDFRNNLFQKGYSGSLINKALYALKAVLEQAEDEGMIKAVPKIPHAVDNPKKKGILSVSEVKELFSEPWTTPEAYCHPSRLDVMGYTANLLAASTGLRLGELQALQLQDIHLDEGYIRVWRSWNTRMSVLNNTTKTGKERLVFIPGNIISEIKKLISLNPYNRSDSFLFYSSIPDKPAEKKILVQSFYRALTRIGITEDIRKERNITFHSWRHWLNSLLIHAKVPLFTVQQITGHTTEKMSSHYFHMDQEAAKSVLNVTESVFQPRSEETTGKNDKRVQGALN